MTLIPWQGRLAAAIYELCELGNVLCVVTSLAFLDSQAILYYSIGGSRCAFEIYCLDWRYFVNYRRAYFVDHPCSSHKCPG